MAAAILLATVRALSTMDRFPPPRGEPLNGIDESGKLKSTKTEPNKIADQESQMKICHVSFVVPLVLLYFGSLAVTEVAAAQRHPGDCFLHPWTGLG